MIDSSRVNVLKTSENLIQEKLNVIIGQRLVGLDNLGEICLHQFGNNINLIETSSVLWLQDSLNAEHIFMVKQSLYLQFPVRPK